MPDSDGEEEEDLEGSMNDTQCGSQTTQYMNDFLDQIALRIVYLCLRLKNLIIITTSLFCLLSFINI